MKLGSKERFRAFLRREKENLAALDVMHDRMRRAMETGRHHLIPAMRKECERLNAARYALDEEFPDVCNRVEVLRG